MIKALVEGSWKELQEKFPIWHRNYRPIVSVLIVVVLLASYAYKLYNNINAFYAVLALSVPLGIGIEKQRLENDKIEKELIEKYYLAFDKEYDEYLSQHFIINK
jgi:hypothetical protein